MRFNPLPALLRRPVRPRISFVIIMFNMVREGARTLHSLTPNYQIEGDRIDYEVIVVENGSTEPYSAERVRSFGCEFRYFALENAPASPVQAINYGVEQAEGEIVCIMIDGAHMLTPGILSFANRAFDIYPNPVVTPHYFYLGPGQQPETCVDGYNQEKEDALLSSIDWPSDGYRLFEIGKIIGMAKRGWIMGKFESNCLFLYRRLFDAVGGYDERFDLRGGGFANLDFYRRVVESPQVTLVHLLGEGTFHQFHGGTTTNISLNDREA